LGSDDNACPDATKIGSTLSAWRATVIGSRSGINGEQPPVRPHADFERVRFSTDDLPEQDRIPAWREFFGRRVFRTEIEPAPDMPFHADVTVRHLPGLDLVSSVMSPARFCRTRALVADSNDDVGFFVSTSGGTIAQRGREFTFHAGDVVGQTVGIASTWTAPSTARYLCLHVRRADLAPLVPDLDCKTLGRQLPPSSEALRYLLAYVRFLEWQPDFLDPTVAHSIAIHLRDLFALALGPTPDAAIVAGDRGLAAARLRAIKRYVADNLGNGGLTIGAVAIRHRVTPRYVQRLFEREGTTFSKFLLDQRLARVQQMLADPRYAGWRVSAIAMEAGFGDLSYFNHCFRRRFGASPTQFRTHALM
jgi:AraC-like DNA-binding protein